MFAVPFFAWCFSACAWPKESACGSHGASQPVLGVRSLLSKRSMRCFSACAWCTFLHTVLLSPCLACGVRLRIARCFSAFAGRAVTYHGAGVKETTDAGKRLLGRERRHVCEASQATEMLASLGSCCWKQLRLRQTGNPALQKNRRSQGTRSSLRSRRQTCLLWSCRRLRMP